MILQVTLPTNFKVARFKDDKLTGILSQLEKDVEAARALSNGVPFIERADKLVQRIAPAKGLGHPEIDRGVALVDRQLEANRKKAAAA